MTQFPPTMPGMTPGLRPHRGVMILVFGILSWAICFIFGIVAWVMGKNDLEAMARGEMDRSGEGLTKAGKIIGMIHVILCAIIIPIWLIIVVIAAMSGGGAVNP
jgi:hypothetical protein